MKINDIHVDGFGVWSDFSIDDLGGGITLFYGPNEAGKTTLMQFLRAVLYGYSAERRERYFPPIAGGTAGGGLRVETPHGRFTVRRTGPSKEETDRGPLTVVGGDGRGEGQPLLDVLLAGVDESIYSNVFAIGLRELQELATLNETDAGRLLYKLASGVDRVSLVDVVRGLQLARGELISPEEGHGQLTRLGAERDRCQRDIDSAAAATRRWVQLGGALRELEEQVCGLEAQIGGLERQSRRLEAALQLRPTWLTRCDVDRSIALLKNLAPIPSGAIDELDDLESRIEQHGERIEDLKRRREILQEEYARIPIDEGIARHAARIEALAEHGRWLTSLEEQIRRISTEVEEMEAELQMQCEQFGISAETVTTHLPDLSPRVMDTLRKPAKAMREYARRRDDARREAEAVARQISDLQTDLQTALEERGSPELAAALSHAGEGATLLRKRIAVEERLEQMLRRRRELEQDVQELSEEQVLSPRRLFYVGLSFIAGVTLILTGVMGGTFFNLTSPAAWFVGLIGLMCVIGSVMAKQLIERQSTVRLRAAQRHLDRLSQQVDSTIREREGIDAELPQGGGPLVSRLRQAESELSVLEELLPREGELQAIRDRRQTLEERAARAEADLEQAKRRWSNALRQAGLPENISPTQLRDLSGRYQQIEELRRRLRARREELEGRNRELATISERITSLSLDCGLKIEGRRPQELLQQLTTKLSQQLHLIEQAKRIRNDEREIVKTGRGHVRARDRLQHRHGALLAQCGVDSPEQLRALAEDWKRLEQFQKQRVQLTAQLESMAGTQFPLEELEEELAQGDQRAIERTLKQHAEELVKLQAQLKQLMERRGEIAHEIKTLTADRTGAEARLEQAIVREQIAEAGSRWQVVAAASRLMEDVRRVYEQQRQPETLQDASAYLAEFTAGAYTRIWTPLDDEVLRVDDAQGRPLPVEILSSGTREALFLSLRLALIKSYARRGAALPVVLDDVLVNFDHHRARAASHVLRDFAKEGHQLLVFTCHEHIARIFSGMQLEVRELPDRHQPGKLQMRWFEEPVEEPLVAEDEPVMEMPPLVEEYDTEIRLLPAAEPEPEVEEEQEDLQLVDEEEGYEEEEAMELLDEDEEEEALEVQDVQDYDKSDLLKARREDIPEPAEPEETPLVVFSGEESGDGQLLTWRSEGVEPGEHALTWEEPRVWWEIDPALLAQMKKGPARDANRAWESIPRRA